jgi:hypothetical protein
MAREIDVPREIPARVTCPTWTTVGVTFLSLISAAARVRARVWSCGICGGQSESGADFPANLQATNCSTITIIYHLTPIFPTRLCNTGSIRMLLSLLRLFLPSDRVWWLLQAVFADRRREERYRYGKLAGSVRMRLRVAMPN